MTTFGRKYLLGMGIALGALTAISGTHQCGAATWQQAQDAGPDPTDQNMAPVDGSQAYQQQYGAQGTVNESQQQAIQATQQGAPIERRAPSDDDNQQQGDYGNQQQDSQQAYSQDDQNYDPNYESNVDAGQEAIEADEPPPPLPVYQQPEAPEPNYIWTPGALLWSAVDAELLGLLRWPLPVPPWLLGVAYRLLWRHQLRLWLLRYGLSRGLLG
jgi:hypothetical protein